MKNKLNNKKGFTIIELLVAIMIIAILAVVAVPLITRFIENGREKYYQSLQNELVIMAKNYYTDNRKELPRGQGGIYFKVLTLQELEKANYVTNEVVDTNKNSCEQSYVTVANDGSGNYEYNACLICADKSYGDEETCVFEGVKDYDIPSCEITGYGNYKIGEWTNQNVKITVEGKDQTGISRFEVMNGTYKTNHDYTKKIEILELTQKTLDKNGKAKVIVYDPSGQSSSCDTEAGIKIDQIKPICKLEIKNQTEKEATIRITASDVDSGIKKITIGNNTITVNEQGQGEFKVNKNGVHKVTITDVAENTNTCEQKVEGLKFCVEGFVYNETTDICSKQFNYNGSLYTFVVPEEGYYKLELYGAKGGNDQARGGYGGDIKGSIFLTTGTNLYIYIGGQGGNRGTSGEATWYCGGQTGICVMYCDGGGGGYNGGAQGFSSGGGGGGTDIRLGGTGIDNRIIVAGGGGGGSDCNVVGLDGGSPNNSLVGKHSGQPNIWHHNYCLYNDPTDGGGGGGGYYGGASGRDCNKSASGGSNYYDSSKIELISQQTEKNSGHGRVVITWIGSSL